MTTLVDQCCKRSLSDESSQKIWRSHHRHRPGRDVFSRPCGISVISFIASYAAAFFVDQLNSVPSIHIIARPHEVGLVGSWRADSLSRSMARSRNYPMLQK